VSGARPDLLPSSELSPTERWFGPRFDELHPLLQRLHREGGRLRGRVEFAEGSGIAGMFGAIARKRLGLTDDSTHILSVVIRNADDGLHWSRRFDAGEEVVSLFRPIGRLPNGHWLERAGPIELKLTVDIVDGGWYWRQLGCRAFGIPLPSWCAPRIDAHKRIEGEGYRFAVAIALPLIGRTVAYAGTLALEPAASTAPI
jgi:Domain of unknown function (DUF4166)